jgi:glucosamine--fructose-6-phosphate aminotransferase (isomerizing)
LYCNVGIEKSVAATKTCSATMYLLACLLAEWTNDAHLKDELLSVPEGISALLAGNGQIEEIAARYRGIHECYMLARGINYPVAMEAALKMQETCYVHAHAYATSDFYHGPYALIQPHTPVMLFAPRGPSLPSVRDMLDRLCRSGAEALAVTNDPEVAGIAAASFMIPDTQDDVISAFYNVVFAQMAAFRLALAMGRNPDAPRNLKKVTITR